MAVYSHFLKEKFSALISSILYTLIDGCYSDRQPNRRVELDESGALLFTYRKRLLGSSWSGFSS